MRIVGSILLFNRAISRFRIQMTTNVICDGVISRITVSHRCVNRTGGRRGTGAIERATMRHMLPSRCAMKKTNATLVPTWDWWNSNARGPLSKTTFKNVVWNARYYDSLAWYYLGARRLAASHSVWEKTSPFFWSHDRRTNAADNILIIYDEVKLKEICGRMSNSPGDLVVRYIIPHDIKSLPL